MTQEEIDLLVENITAYISTYAMIVHPPHEGDPEERWQIYFRHVLKSYFDKQTKLKENIFQNVPATRVWENDTHPWSGFSGAGIWSGAAQPAAPAPNSTITVAGTTCVASPAGQGVSFPAAVTFPSSPVGTSFTITTTTGNVSNVVWDGTAWIDSSTGNPYINKIDLPT